MRTGMRVMGGLVLVVAFAASAGAQSLGVKGGWAHPTLAGKDAEGAKALNTFSGGGFLSAKVSPAFAVEVDALYALKGAQETAEGVTAKVKLGYIEVPVLARVIVPVEKSKVEPSIFAGPYVAFKTNCTVKGSTEGISVSMDCSEMEGGAIKSTDFGLAFGGGVAFPLGTRVSGLLEGRYDLGLTKIDDGTPQADVKNRSLMVFAGVSIPVGRRAQVESTRTR